MEHAAHPHHARQAGFTLIELLVVILIIGILAAIAIPLFLNQKSKAHDAGAKVIARSAETAMESWATQNEGSYAGATVSSLQSIEPSLITSSTSQAYLSMVSAPNAQSYTVAAYSPLTSESFSVVKNGPTVTHPCSGTGGGCENGSW